MSELKETLKQKLLPLIEEEKLELVELEFVGKPPRSLLRVYVDTISGVDVEQCARLSRKLSDFLDTEDLIESRYILEVSSPGLDRPLLTLNDFRRKKGEKVMIYLKTSSDKVSEIKGIIERVADGKVILKEHNKVEAIPLEKIEKGKIII